MTGRTRQALLAAGAAGAVLLVVLVRARGDDPAGTPAVERRPAASAGARSEAGVPDLKLEFLDAAHGDPGAPARNPFRFQTPAALDAWAPSDDDAAPPPAGPPPVLVPPGPPAPPPIPLRFIGLFDAPAQSVRLAVLSDGRGNVFYGREGDIIEGRYKVWRVSADAVELSHLDGRGRQTIRLSGQ